MTVDVRVPHPEYAQARLSIMAARDCFCGERAVKARDDLYLPRLAGQRSDEYQAYKLRATFYSIVGRTIGALAGMAMQGDVAKVGNEETLSQMDDTAHGMQLFESSNMAVIELLLQGKIGMLIDAPEQANTVGFYGYTSDSIINWDVNDIDEYVMVVLKECRLVVDQNNPFKKTEEEQYRVLTLEGGVYTVTLYDRASKVLSRVQPTFRGITLDYIPFYTALPDGLRSGIAKSPMEDMVSVNMSHYRTSADLEHGRHFVGLPTPVITGSDVSGKLKVGGSTAWVLPEHQAKAFYLEFTGQGLQSLEKALQEKEAQLSSLSSSVISRSIRGSESPDAIRLRMSSETASLYMIVKTIQNLMTLIYNVKSTLEGYAQDIVLTFPTQFVSGQVTADEILKYSTVYIEGGMTVEDYVAILRRGGALSASRTDSDVTAGLQKLATERAAAVLQANQPKPQPN